MKKLKYGIVGYGWAGKTHARVINQKLKSLVKLYAVCDIDSEKLAQAKNKYNVLVTNDFRELLKYNLDAISICTPHYLHFRMAKEAILARLPFLIEKPVVMLLNESKELLKLIKNDELICGTVLQHRFELANKLVKQAIIRGDLGKINTTSVNVKWKKSNEYYNDWHGDKNLCGGGVLLTQAIHFIDLACWFNEGVKSVYGKLRYDRKLSVEDSALGIIEFISGANGTIDCTTSANPGFGSTIEIIGSINSVKIQEGRIIKWGGMSENDINKKNEEINYIDSQTWGKKYFGYGHIYQIRDFISAVIERTPPLVTIEDGLKTLKVILSIEKSWLDKKEVML